MPLTHVIDHRKERDNINKLFDLKVRYRKWASLGIWHIQRLGLCSFVLSCPQLRGLPGIRPRGKKEKCYPPTSGLRCDWKKINMR